MAGPRVVTPEEGPEHQEAVCERTTLARGEDTCKGPEAGPTLVCEQQKAGGCAQTGASQTQQGGKHGLSSGTRPSLWLPAGGQAACPQGGG